MTKLTDTQLVILSAAAQRPDRQVLPLPDRIKGGAANKVVTGLLKRGLVAERTAGRDDPIWRETKTGYLRTLVATDAALDALGIEREDTSEGSDTAPDGAAEAPGEDAATDGASAGVGGHKARTPRTGTKQAKMIAMLRAEGGATIAEIAEATGWLPRTVRGAIAGALKKRLGLTVTSEKVDARGRVYRLPEA